MIYIYDGNCYIDGGRNCIALVGVPRVCYLTENSSNRCQLHYIDGNHYLGWCWWWSFCRIFILFYSEQHVDKLLNAHPVIWFDMYHVSQKLSIRRRTFLWCNMFVHLWAELCVEVHVDVCDSEPFPLLLLHLVRKLQSLSVPKLSKVLLKGSLKMSQNIPTDQAFKMRCVNVKTNLDSIALLVSPIRTEIALTGHHWRVTHNRKSKGISLSGPACRVVEISGKPNIYTRLKLSYPAIQIEAQSEWMCIWYATYTNSRWTWVRFQMGTLTITDPDVDRLMLFYYWTLFGLFRLFEWFFRGLVVKH